MQVFHRLGTKSSNQADLDNQIVTHLHAETDSGLAPAAWRSHIGTVIAARKDKKPLLPHHLEGVWMYVDHIQDFFGEGHAPTHLYNRAAFEKWWINYATEQKGYRSGKGGEDDADDWRAVKSPFEV